MAEQDWIAAQRLTLLPPPVAPSAPVLALAVEAPDRGHAPRSLDDPGAGLAGDLAALTRVLLGPATPAVPEAPVVLEAPVAPAAVEPPVPAAPVAPVETEELSSIFVAPPIVEVEPLVAPSVAVPPPAPAPAPSAPVDPWLVHPEDEPPVAEPRTTSVLDAIAFLDT